MKVKDSAMGMWFKRLDDEDQAAQYIAGALYNTRQSVFWDIVEKNDLKANDPVAFGHKVLEHLMEFDESEWDERNEGDQ
mgnify:CR=1 FL=1